MVEGTSLLRTVHFKDLEKWNVNIYVNSHNISFKYNAIKLEQIIIPRKERIKNKEYNGQYSIVEKIRFNDGRIFLRSEKNPKTDLNVSCKNDLLVSNINFEKGAFSLNSFGTIVTSTDYQSYKIIYPIDYDFFFYTLRCEVFLNLVKSLKSGGMKTRARYDFIKQFKIPVPPLEEQKSIIQKYNDAISESERLEKKAEVEEIGIDDYIFKSLGINKISLEHNKDKILNISSFTNMYNWDAKHAILNVSPLTLLKSNKYKNVPIQSQFAINPSTPYPETLTEVTFLPMECISDIYGSVIEKRTINAKTKGYTKFRDNDVIFAKITPCMQNGKCAVVNGLKSGYGMGSTEFHVFRSISKESIPEYLHALLRTTMLRKAAINYFTGSSGQQRVSSEFIENLYIPLPPQSVQEEIVSHINEIKANVKSLRKQASDLRTKAKQDFENTVFN